MGATVCLPLLEAMLPMPALAAGQAAGGRPPVRMAVLYMANGINPHEWLPNGTGSAFELSPILAPLATMGIVLLVSIFILMQREDLRDRMIREITTRIPDTYLNGHPAQRLPNNASLRFDRIEGQTLVISLTLAGFDASTSSACTSGSLEPSHVLSALGLDPVRARATVRFSLGRTTSEDDIARLLAILPGTIERLRGLSEQLVGGAL